MAGNQLAPAELPSEEQYVSAPPSADFLYLYDRPRRVTSPDVNRFTYPDTRATPTNEYGIAQPIFTLGCECGECGLYTRHHLHSTDPLFRGAGPISTEFRVLQTLSVWTPRCQHNEQHTEYSTNTFLPSVEIMEQCIYEEKIIRDIVMNGHTLLGLSRTINNIKTHPNNMVGLNRWREKLLAERPGLLNKLSEVVVTPEELVTGALLLAAPSHAQSRLMEGKGYVLTGVLPREKIHQANEFAQQVLSETEADSSLQNRGDGVKLAA